MRLIDADAYIAELEHMPMVQDAIRKSLEHMPTIEERKTGKWIKVGHWGRHYKCDQCGNYLDFDGVNSGRGDANFCPNCGADMRGKQDETD